MPKMRRLLLLLCVTLSCKVLQTPKSLVMPASMPVDNAVPADLRIGDVQTRDGMVMLTPEQAAKLAAQVKYFRGQMVDQYMLGRREGEIVIAGMTRQVQWVAAEAQARDKIWLRACVGALLLGIGTGAVLSHTLDK